MGVVVIGDLPKSNAFHRVCWCRKCGSLFIGDVKLKFQRFSQTITGVGDPNDGYYICPECGEDLIAEWVKVRFEGEICK